MGCGVLRAEVDCIVPYLAILDILTVWWSYVIVLRIIGVYRVAEAFVDGDEARACLFCGSFRGRSIVPWVGGCDCPGREAWGEGAWSCGAYTKALGRPRCKSCEW